MANSIYEYVKSFEVEDEVMLPNLIAVLIQGRNFHRFCNIHDFEKPNDEKALNLMNSCATAVLEKYPDIVYSYGFSDEYSFVFKKDSTLYQRRSRNMTQSRLTIIHYPSLRAKLAWRCLSPISYFGNWKYYFPHTELRFPPSFKSRVIVCASPEVLQHYLKWRQDKCHAKNLCSTCLWMLIIKHEKTEREAQKVLEETQTIEGKHELLFKEFDINYNNLPIMFRQGSCALKTELEDIVKYTDDGTPIKRLRRKVIVVHAKNIASRSFWNGHPCLVKELGRFKEDINKVKPEFEKSFKFEHTLMPSTWIVVRIDGCHFHRFSEVHEFERPNDGQALKLMNSCAVATLEEFQENQDIVFSYGVSDEYSFVLKKDSQLYQRRASCIVSVIVSFFSSMYVMKWKEFFPQKELKYPPYFDGRAVCYPSTEILQDYLAWRQVDCHINNQYNTCFWMLVKSGKSKREAQKVTQSEKKNDLFKEFDLHYETLPAMFRRGSSVFWDKEVETVMHDDDDVPRGKFQKKVVIEHCDIIKPNFWKEHPSILDEKQAMLSV